MSALPQGADLFASDAPQPHGYEPAYQVRGRLLHAAEVRYLAINDGVHTHGLVMDMASDDTGAHIQAVQPFAPQDTARMERLAKTMQPGQRVQVVASLKSLCLRLNQVQQVTLLPTNHTKH